MTEQATNVPLGAGRAILRLVRDDERSAGEIAGQFPTITRPAVSQHLKVLHDAGLVSVRAAGKFRLFKVRPQGMAEMWELVDEMWTDRLGRLKIVAERAEWSQRPRARLAEIDPTDSPTSAALLPDYSTRGHQS